VREGNVTTGTPPATANEDSDSQTAPSVIPGGMSVTGSAGTKVMVSNVSVTKPTWIVVYDNNNGVAGNALGAKLFAPVSQGGSTSGAITLLRATKTGQTYLIGQNVDNGDAKFSKQLDKAVTGADGKPLLMTFEPK